MVVKALCIICCVGAVVFAAAPLAFAAPPEIVAVEATDGRIEAVEVRGLGAARLAALGDPSLKEWQRLFSVYVAGAAQLGVSPPPPILGDYTTGESSIRFEPRFPFSSGLSYRARFNVSRFNGADTATPFWIEHVFAMPSATVDGTTTVTAIYPSSDAWPENALKFYVHFSQTMKRGGAYDNVHLIDDRTGEAVVQAFVETTPELWDPHTTRLTMLFHPGRVKQGLQMNELSGPPLEAGRTYTIVIDRALVDANRQPLADTYRKTIRVEAADRTGPDPTQWQLAPPAAGTGEALSVAFDEAIDRALLDRFLKVVDGAGQAVPGRIVVSGGEQSWAYVPEAAWAAGRYQLLVSRRLEDRAGNTPARLFDAEMRDGEADASERAAHEADAFIRLDFEIR